MWRGVAVDRFVEGGISSGKVTLEQRPEVEEEAAMPRAGEERLMQRTE